MNLPRYMHTKGDISVLTEYLPFDWGKIYEWVKKCSKTDLFAFYDVYLVGSILHDVDEPKDIDILVHSNAEDIDPNEVYKDMLECLEIGRVQMKMNIDMLYFNDISFFNLPYNKSYLKEYTCYAPYNLELLIVEGKLEKFRNFNINNKWGLLTEHKIKIPSIKGLDRAYPEYRYELLNKKF